jgi:hypothetical protein
VFTISYNGPAMFSAALKDVISSSLVANSFNAIFSF